MEIELKPCPFCGGTNINPQWGMPDREGTPTNMTCEKCGAIGPWGYENDWKYVKAIAAWNTRPNEWRSIETAPANKEIDVYGYCKCDSQRIPDVVRHDDGLIWFNSINITGTKCPGCGDKITISHWMPLPEPPKEGE